MLIVYGINYFLMRRQFVKRKNFFSYVCLLLVFGVFLFFTNSYGYTLRTSEKTVSLNNMLTKVIDSDNTHMYLFGQSEIGSDKSKLAKINIETKEIISQISVSRSGSELYPYKVRVTDNRIYAAGLMVDKSNGRVSFFMSKFSKNPFNYILSYFYDEDIEFPYDGVSCCGYVFNLTDEGTLLVGCSMSDNTIKLLRFTRSSMIWESNWDIGITGVGGITQSGSYVYVSGTLEYPWWYIAKFSYSTGAYILNKAILSPFCIDRGTLVAQLKAQGNYLYTILTPSVTSCIEGVDCDAVLYKLYKFDINSLSEIWTHTRQSGYGAGIHIMDLSISEAEDVYVSDILVNGIYESNTIRLLTYKQNTGALLGVWKSDSYPCNHIITTSAIIYSRDDVNLVQLGHSIDQERLLLVESVNTDTTINNFWIPSRVTGEIHFEFGWNFFSLPTISDINLTPQHFQEILNGYIYKWDDDFGYGPLDYDEQLLPGVGYWCEANQEAWYQVVGMEILQALYLETSHWSAYGFGTYPGFVTEIISGNLKAIYEYEPGFGYEYLNGGPTKQGYGYWVGPSPGTKLEFKVDQEED